MLQVLGTAHVFVLSLIVYAGACFLGHVPLPLLVVPKFISSNCLYDEYVMVFYAFFMMIYAHANS